MGQTLPLTMLAARIDRFGGPDVVSITEIPVPVPGPNEVLVRILAAGVGPWDARIRSGKDTMNQTLPLTLGADFAGVVVIGAGGFAANDLVFGATNARFTGAQAQFAVAEASRIAASPPGLSSFEAAAVPVVGVTAATMLFELGGLTLGQRVLIHGAEGSVGGLAVQFAKRAGAHVIAACLSRDVTLVEGLGADEIVILETTPFVGAVKYADLVIDLVGGVVQTASFDVLIPGGRLVSAVSEPDRALAADRHVSTRYFLVDVTRTRLDRLAALLSAPRPHIVIGEELPLAAVRRAHVMLEGAPHKPGKIVLDVLAAS